MGEDEIHRQVEAAEQWAVNEAEGGRRTRGYLILESRRLAALDLGRGTLAEAYSQALSRYFARFGVPPEE